MEILNHSGCVPGGNEGDYYDGGSPNENSHMPGAIPQ